MNEEALRAENASLHTKLTHLEYAMNTVAQFVRPRIPADQNPEQATSFLAWIGMILRLEERAEQAEARTTAALAERDHWQANHAEMVQRNAVLRERPDLPADRLPSIARYEARIAKLESALALISEDTMHDAVNGGYLPTPRALHARAALNTQATQ